MLQSQSGPSVQEVAFSPSPSPFNYLNFCLNPAPSLSVPNGYSDSYKLNAYWWHQSYLYFLCFSARYKHLSDWIPACKITVRSDRKQLPFLPRFMWQCANFPTAIQLHLRLMLIPAEQTGILPPVVKRSEPRGTGLLTAVSVWGVDRSPDIINMTK